MAKQCLNLQVPERRSLLEMMLFSVQSFPYIVTYQIMYAGLGVKCDAQ